MVGYLYVNYSHTNNSYSYVKLILKKVNLKKSSLKILLLLHTIIHVWIELTRRNTFNVRIATAINIRG